MLDPRLCHLARSYRFHTGRDLCRGEERHNLPWGIVAHGTEDPPRFWYANHVALTLFETDFDHFTTLESRESAEPGERAERERLLGEVTRNGFSDDYAGIRVSRRGRRFRIASVTVWNILAFGPDGTDGPLLPEVRVGQAACIRSWTFL